MSGYLTKFNISLANNYLRIEYLEPTKGVGMKNPLRTANSGGNLQHELPMDGYWKVY